MPRQIQMKKGAMSTINKKTSGWILKIIGLVGVEGMLLYFEVWLRIRLLASLCGVHGPLDNPGVLAQNAIANTILLMASIYLVVVVGVGLFQIWKNGRCKDETRRTLVGCIVMTTVAIASYFWLMGHA